MLRPCTFNVDPAPYFVKNAKSVELKFVKDVIGVTPSAILRKGPMITLIFPGSFCRKNLMYVPYKQKGRRIYSTALSIINSGEATYREPKITRLLSRAAKPCSAQP